MKKNAILSILLILVMLLGNAAFAGSDYASENTPLASNQKVLFTLDESGIEAPRYIYDLGYDRGKDHLYIIVRTNSDEDEVVDENGEEIEFIKTEQYVYSLETKEEVTEPDFPLLPGYYRLGIEFEADQTWSVERPEAKLNLLLNNFESELIGESASVEGKGFAIQGNRVLYFLKGCDDEENFLVGEIDSSAEPGELVVSVDEKNPINNELNYIKGYDFSEDGKEVIFIGTEFIDATDDEDDDLAMNVVVRVDSETKQEIDRFAVLPPDGAINVEAYDLYTTEEHIVVLYKDWDLHKGYIERYTYDGVRIDGVETNQCIRKITEGPNGSTIYIQMRYPKDMNLDNRPRGPLEVIQINWENNSSTSSSNESGPRPVIQEKTRAGHTVARFTDSHFGLLRVEEPETGVVDYQAPIRSHENLVKLQIPYCDIKAKFESGVRNLLVEYQGQELSFSMDLFDCDELLVSMPCQSDATIEIIMHTDEEGNVTYEVQLFVVEQVDGMTKVVHRKMIQ